MPDEQRGQLVGTERLLRRIEWMDEQDVPGLGLSDHPDQVKVPRQARKDRPVIGGASSRGVAKSTSDPAR